MQAIQKLIKQIQEKMEDAIYEAKAEESHSCSLSHCFNDGCFIEIESKDNNYYDIIFYPANEEKDGREYPNLSQALYDAMPDWNDIELEPEYDEWNEHGFANAADYYHWRYG